MTNSKVARVPVSKEKECFSTSSGNLNYRRTYIRLQVKVLPRQDLGGNTYLPSPPPAPPFVPVWSDTPGTLSGQPMKENGPRWSPKPKMPIDLLSWKLIPVAISIYCFKCQQTCCIPYSGSEGRHLGQNILAHSAPKVGFTMFTNSCYNNPKIQRKM